MRQLQGPHSPSGPPSGDRDMNWDQVEDNWKQLKGTVQQEWSKLTNDNLDVIAGNRKMLSGKIQEAYGISKDEAEEQIEEFEYRYGDWMPEDVPRSAAADLRG